MKVIKMLYHLFEGEGSGEGGMSAEASAFLDSLPGGNKEEAKKESTEKPAQSAKGEEETRQVGTDKTLDDEFAELIGKNGKFHDLYGKAVSEAVQSRFKNQADYQAQVKGYEQAFAPLMDKYGLKEGDIDGLVHAIAEDDDTYRAGAEQAGMDINQYKYNKQLEADAARGRAIVQEYEEQQRRNQVYQAWEQDAQELKSAFPNFDLGAEIDTNPRFAALLNGGASPREAFAATHLSELINGMNGETTRTAQAELLNDIKRQASRPPESALTHSPAAQKRVDPSKFTGEDIDKILKRVEQGEKLSFY